MPPDKLIQSVSKAMATIFVTCTYGEGEFPETMEKLWDYLEGCDKGIFPENSFRYAVFGLGSSMYAVGDQFNRAAKRLDQKLAILGATRIIDVGLGDDQHSELYRGEMDKWVGTLLPNLFGEEAVKASFLDPPEPLFRLSLAPGSHGPKFRPLPPNYHFVRLEAAESLVSEGYDRPASLFTLDLEDTGLKYDVGDHVAILPRNPEKIVEKVLSLYSSTLKGSNLLAVEPLDKLSETPFPPVLTAKELLTQYLDLCGRPSRSFFKQLFLFATTVESRHRLRALFEADNPNADQVAFELYTATHTYADVLCEFAHTGLPPFEYLLSMIPVICPRLYSIASSPLHKTDKLDILVVLMKWVDERKKMRVGLSTQFLFGADIGENVAVQIRTGILQPPEDPKTPVLMFGLGTGVAPFRGFLQHRQKLLEQGEELGPATLYVGYRHEKHDYYLKEDFKKWINEGVLTVVHPAFSHDNVEERGGKLYFISDLIGEKPMDMVKALQLADGQNGSNIHVYYCGPALGIPETIQKAMEEAISRERGGGMAYMDRLVRMEDRFHAECF
jgi:sulfite reductase alpha subunit-like flavoprotein